MFGDHDAVTGGTNWKTAVMLAKECIIQEYIIQECISKILLVPHFVMQFRCHLHPIIH